MAKIIQTVSTIRFDDLADLTKHALRYLKTRFVKNGVEEFGEFIHLLLDAATELEPGNVVSMIESIDERVNDCDSTVHSCSFDDEPGVLTFDQALAAVQNGYGIVNLRANLFEMHSVDTFHATSPYDLDHVGWIRYEEFHQFISMLSEGKLAFSHIGYVSGITSPATKIFFPDADEDSTSKTDGTLEVVSEVDMSAPDVSLTVAPASVTVRVPMSAEQRAGADPVVEDFVDPMFQDFVGGPEKNGN